MGRTWSDVGELARERRDALGLSREAMAEKANRLVGTQAVSTANITIFEQGKRTSYRARTLLGIARALDWPDTALTDLLQGADPASLAGPTATGADDDRSDELLAAVRELTAVVRDLRARLDRDEP